MKIRQKIVLLVLPLIIATVLLTSIASYFSASAGINRLARDFLGFKVQEMQKYALTQWQLLEENGKTDDPDWRMVNQQAVENYASSIIQSASQLIFALDTDGDVRMSTRTVRPKDNEGQAIVAGFNQVPDDLITLPLEGTERVMKGFWFEPYQWYVMVSDLSESFYSDLNQITTRSILVLAISLVVSMVMLFYFSGNISRPLGKIISTMKGIISSGDLSETVEVEYDDETGMLAHTFNIMTGELDRAWKQIKNYALQAVLAEKREKKTRVLFQKYVPQDVVNQVIQNPDGMLIGQDRQLSVLFSDIRSFTTISESMSPGELVNTLNRYFSVMVDIIDRRGGIVDKYIGDAIMAFFGAPARHEGFPLASVEAGLDMKEAVRVFNQDQTQRGKPHFNIGLGINYGIVTVGNIGTEKKMDYTVIGDNVNLASRMEGLTKEYKEELLITDSLRLEIQSAAHLSFRFIDIVAVKGKAQGVRIFGVERNLAAEEQQRWKRHNQAMETYLARDFAQARTEFAAVLAGAVQGEDYHAERMIDRCLHFMDHPPAQDWNGVTVMDHK